LRPYLKNTQQKRLGAVALGVGPEFKPQYHTHIHTKKANKETKKPS
jgi:hypothetical protein